MTWSVAFTGQWESQLIDLVSRYMEPGTLAIDAGASLGLWSVQLGRHASAIGARVLAVEPSQENVAWLRRNVELNGLRTVIDIHEVALGSTNSTAWLRLHEPGGGNASLGVGADEEGREVDVVPLDELPRESRVSLIKLDVEGYELEALRGARSILLEDRPVVFGEFDPQWFAARAQDAGAWLVEATEELGYELFAVTPSRSAAWRPMDTLALVPLQAPFAQLPGDLLLIPSER